MSTNAFSDRNALYFNMKFVYLYNYPGTWGSNFFEIDAVLTREERRQTDK